MGATIELNGRKYDARTGQIIDDSVSTEATQPTPAPTPAPAHHTTRPQKSSGQILDGFMKRKVVVKDHHTVSATNRDQVDNHHSEHAHPVTTTKNRSSSRAVAQNAKRKLEKSKTLMRPSVKKPVLPKSDITPMKPAVKTPGHSVAREARAQMMPRSPHVSRFGEPKPIVKKEVELPVAQQPLQSIPTLTQAVHKEINRMEHALDDANAHLRTFEETMVKKVPFLRRVGFKNKAANLATMTAAFLLLVGFFGYQNKTLVEMKVAAQQSGVSANLPGYKPAGYAVKGGVQAEPGKVRVSYKSTTDDRGYTLTQQASNWNSTALLANHVTKNHCNTCFQTWQNEGKTVYVYDNSNATWVSGGVWYMVEGNANLSTDQLLKIASSL